MHRERVPEMEGEARFEGDAAPEEGRCQQPHLRHIGHQLQKLLLGEFRQVVRLELAPRLIRHGEEAQDARDGRDVGGARRGDVRRRRVGRLQAPAARRVARDRLEGEGSVRRIAAVQCGHRSEQPLEQVGELPGRLLLPGLHARARAPSQNAQRTVLTDA